MAYPLSLLPSRKYKLRLDFDDLSQRYPQLYAVRQVEGEKQDYIENYDGYPTFNQNLFKGIDILSLSLNLLGGKYQLSHLPFLPQGPKSYESWDGKKVKIKSHEIPYKETKPCFPVFFRVSEFQNGVFPYNKVFNSVEEMAEFSERLKRNGVKDLSYLVLEKFKKNQPQKIEGKVKLNHSPKTLNYWHSSLDFYLAESQEPLLPENKTSAIDKATKRYKVAIVKLLQVECDNYEKIPSREYIEPLWKRIKNFFVPKSNH